MRKWLGSYRIMAILSVLMLAMAFGSSPALGGNGSDAQGPPDRLELERLHNRVFPLFAIAGVVYTDVIEETGRLEVGIARQGVTGEVESELGRLNVPRAQVDIVVTEPIVQVETLRDRV
ncbi:MAG: hypothetical protein HYX93_06925, partial [Chloroflexi bacterium]|nr:hypothetical protein [Chloroflexota bacterium]